MAQLRIWINQYFQYFVQNQVLSVYSIHKSECSLLNSLDFFAFNVLPCLWTARTIQKFSPWEVLKSRRVPKELKQALLSIIPLSSHKWRHQQYLVHQFLRPWGYFYTLRQKRTVFYTNILRKGQNSTIMSMATNMYKFCIIWQNKIGSIGRFSIQYFDEQL